LLEPNSSRKADVGVRAAAALLDAISFRQADFGVRDPTALLDVSGSKSQEPRCWFLPENLRSAASLLHKFSCGVAPANSPSSRVAFGVLGLPLLCEASFP
jgi:hypothetical protein